MPLVLPMPELTLRELRNFVTLADTRSVTAAARLVGLSQPAMSTSMAHLEQVIGVTLFVRHRGRGISLTPEGELLAHEARQLLVHAHEVHLRFAAVEADAVGQVTVGSLVTVAPIVLPRLVRSFNESLPNIAVNVRTGAQDQLLEWLGRGEIHVAITYDLELSDKYAFRHVTDAVAMAVLPGAHRLASRTSLHLSELADEPYILLDLPLSRHYFTLLFLSSDLPYQPALRIDDLSLVRSLVSNGFGYSLVNLRPASDQALDGGSLAYVPLETPVPPLRLGVAWLASSTQPRPVQAFVDFASQTVDLTPPDR